MQDHTCNYHNGRVFLFFYFIDWITVVRGVSQETVNYRSPWGCCCCAAAAAVLLLLLDVLLLDAAAGHIATAIWSRMHSTMHCCIELFTALSAGVPLLFHRNLITLGHFALLRVRIPTSNLFARYRYARKVKAQHTIICPVDALTCLFTMFQRAYMRYCE